MKYDVDGFPNSLLFLSHSFLCTATGGACSDLERTNVPINNNTVPTTTGTSAGSSPSASGTTPVGTGVPDKGKGNAAGKFATNTFLAVAAAVGAAAFAL